MPNLGVLYLQGNPCVKKIQHYRKVVTARMPTLKYLDDRPVFEDERLRAEAWYAAFQTGGIAAAKEAEKNEIERQKQEKADRDERNFRGALPSVLGLGVTAIAWLTVLSVTQRWRSCCEGTVPRMPLRRQKQPVFAQHPLTSCLKAAMSCHRWKMSLLALAVNQMALCRLQLIRMPATLQRLRTPR